MSRSDVQNSFLETVKQTPGARTNIEILKEMPINEAAAALAIASIAKAHQQEVSVDAARTNIEILKKVDTGAVGAGISNIALRHDEHASAAFDALKGIDTTGAAAAEIAYISKFHQQAAYVDANARANIDLLKEMDTGAVAAGIFSIGMEKKPVSRSSWSLLPFKK